MSDNYREVLEKARREFAEKEPSEMACRTASCYQFYPPLSIRRLLLPYLGRFYSVSWPDGSVHRWGTGAEEEVSFSTSLILLHYPTSSSGQAPLGKWLSFKELWGGRSYFAAFEKRAQQRLAHFFHRQKEGVFPEAMQKLGGKRHRDYPNGYLLFALPRLPLLCLLHRGDDEVPTRAVILFDEAANTHLETEDLAVLGEALAARAEKASGEAKEKAD